MTAPAITVDGVAYTDAAAVLRGATVTLSLVSLTGIDTVLWELDSMSSSALTLPTLVTPTASTCTFTMPDRNNQAYGGRVTVNKGLGANREAYTTFIVGVVNTRGRIPFVPGEEYHRGSRGWSDALNEATDPLYQSRFTSTNNTDTTIHTIPMATDEQTVFDCYWHARDTVTNADTFAKRMQVYARRNSTGIVTVVSSSTPLPNEAIDASWTGTAVSDGASNLLIKAKGDSANPVLWYVSTDVVFTTR